jgi:hypothetical protein
MVTIHFETGTACRRIAAIVKVFCKGALGGNLKADKDGIRFVSAACVCDSAIMLMPEVRAVVVTH